MNSSNKKYADRLVSALQRSGKCANALAAFKYVKDVIEKHNETYRIRLKAFEEESVLIRFNRFVNELSCKMGERFIAVVLGGYIGVELLNRWEKEQKDALTEEHLNDACAEIKEEIVSEFPMSSEFTDDELRLAVIAISTTPSPFEFHH